MNRRTCILFSALLLLSQVSGETFTITNVAYTFLNAPVGYYVDPSGYVSIQFSDSQGAWLGYDSKSQTLGDLTDITNSEFCGDGTDYFYVSNEWGYYCWDGHQKMINQFDPSNQQPVDQIQYTGGLKPILGSQSDYIIFGNLLNNGNTIQADLFDMQSNSFSCQLSATLPSDTKLGINAVVGDYLVYQAVGSSGGQSLNYLACGSDSPVETNLQNLPNYDHIFALNDSSVYVFFDPSGSNFDVYSLGSNGSFTFKTRRQITGIATASEGQHTILQGNDTTIFLPLMIGENNDIYIGTFMVNENWLFVETAQGVLQPGPNSFNYFTQIVGTTQIIVEFPNYFLVFDYYLNQVVDVQQESYEYQGSVYPPMTMANGSIVYAIQYGYWIKTGSEFWFTNMYGTMFFNQGDYSNIYGFDQLECQASWVSLSQSTVYTASWENCPCSSLNAVPVTAYLDSNNDLNIGYFCGQNQFYIANPNNANGPFNLPLSEGQYFLNLGVNLNSGTVATIASIVGGYGMIVYQFGLSNHSLIAKWPYVVNLQNFYGIALNGQYGIGVGYNSSGSTIYLVDLVNLNIHSSFSTSQSLKYESVVYSSPVVIGANSSNPATFGGFLLEHTDKDFSDQAIWVGGDGSVQIVNSSVSFTGNGPNSFVMFQEGPNNNNDNFLVTVLYYQVGGEAQKDIFSI